MIACVDTSKLCVVYEKCDNVPFSPSFTISHTGVTYTNVDSSRTLAEQRECLRDNAIVFQDML